jgi:hypothetical protein
MEYKTVLDPIDLENLYGSRSFGEVPNAAHKEITNKQLKILYICNIVLSLVTLAVAINEIVINSDCVVCTDSGREAAYWVAIFALVASVLCAVLNIFALATRSGFSKIK